MARHGRDARPVRNVSVSRVLEKDECQYLTTRGHCDCGTVLASLKTQEETGAGLVRQAARLARKGWSKAKIDRAINDHRKSDARPAKVGPDSFALWAEIIEDIFGNLDVSRAGLLVQYYSSNVEDEEFTVTRRDVRGASSATLESIRSGEILVFHRK